MSPKQPLARKPHESWHAMGFMCEKKSILFPSICICGKTARTAGYHIAGYWKQICSTENVTSFSAVLYAESELAKLINDTVIENTIAVCQQRPNCRVANRMLDLLSPVHLLYQHKLAPFSPPWPSQRIVYTEKEPFPRATVSFPL